MLDKLALLHNEEWQSPCERGAFASSFFRRFHRTLIKERFDNGEIQIVEIQSEDDPIGFLYNFVYDNQVLFYQSGFAYRPENQYKPGIVSHYLAIEYNLNKGLD